MKPIYVHLGGALALSFTIAACVPAPDSTPAPTPTPTPTSSQPTTNLPGRRIDGRIIVVAEGGSNSADYDGYYTGHYRNQHPEVDYFVTARGGSTVRSMSDRISQVMQLNPDIVTIFIGANDLGKYSSSLRFIEELKNYTTILRKEGVRVLVGTLLPRTAGSNITFNNNHNALRAEVAETLKASVGKDIDGVIDWGGDPIMGKIEATYDKQLYSDGLHPTDRRYRHAKGGHDYLYETYDSALDKAITHLDRF